MGSISHILLYSTEEKGSRPTIRKVLELAQIHRAQLTLVDVLEPPPSRLQRFFSSSVHVELRKSEEQRAKKRLDRLAAIARDSDVEADTEVLFGKPFVELIRAAVRRRCDLTVKKAQGLSGLSERLFGSTALHLVRKSPVPVLVVQPKQRIQFRRILVPLDFRADHPSEDSLNASIMDMALSMSEREGGELHFFHAWQPYGVSTLTSGRFRMPAERVRDYVRSLEMRQKERFEEFLHGYPLNHVKHRDHFLRGEAATHIPELAARHRISLIVMGSTYSLGLGGVFVGSTAEQILSQVRCSILTVKPEGFVTPVDAAPGNFETVGPFQP